MSFLDQICPKRVFPDRKVSITIKYRLVLIGFFDFRGNLGDVKEKPTRKLVFPVKWSTCLGASILQNFAGWHLFDFNEVSTVFLWEKDVKTSKTMGKVLKRKLESSVVAYFVAGKILRSTEIKFEETKAN